MEFIEVCLEDLGNPILKQGLQESIQWSFAVQRSGNERCRGQNQPPLRDTRPMGSFRIETSHNVVGNIRTRILEMSFSWSDSGLLFGIFAAADCSVSANGCNNVNR